METSPVADGAKPPAENPSPWRQLAADFVLWLVFVALLLAFRATLLWIFREKLSPQVRSEAFFRCFKTGLRFDICAATYAILPSLLLTLVGFWRSLGGWHERVRRWFTGLLMTLCVLAFVTDTAYFAEYDDQFDHWIIGLVYDDRRAIGLTIWKEYPIVWLLILGVLATWAVAWAVNKLWRSVSSRVRPSGKWNGVTVRGLAVLLVLGVAFLGLRGSLGRRPIQLKDAFVTGDVFLNKMVLNPFHALHYAISQHLTMKSAKGLDAILPKANLRAVGDALFPQNAGAATLDDMLKRTAPGFAGPKPNHIFILMMESYDIWAMQPAYTNLHLTDRLAALGREGIQVRAFVSSAESTIKSLASVISGLPYAGVFVNYQAVVRQNNPLAAARIFGRLGYRTRFFYCGYLSWQRLGDFCREQGFDEVYGGDSIAAKLTGYEWGVADELMFNFILEHTGDEPTFDLIMSTSYHPPFGVDLKAKGFKPEQLLANPLAQTLTPKQIRVLGHLWYSDKCIADFVEAAEKKLSRPVFAITGDHFSREECLNPRPTLYERRAVPFVLYGREVFAITPRPTNAPAGAHYDMLPTLINLAAPAGFEYQAFGHDLLDATQPQVGLGMYSVIGPDFIVETRGPVAAEDLNGNPPPSGLATNELVLRYRQLEALSWWRSMKGSEWPKK